MESCDLQSDKEVGKFPCSQLRDREGEKFIFRLYGLLWGMSGLLISVACVGEERFSFLWLASGERKESRRQEDKRRLDKNFLSEADSGAFISFFEPQHSVIILQKSLLYMINFGLPNT